MLKFGDVSDELCQPLVTFIIISPHLYHWVHILLCVTFLPSVLIFSKMRDDVFLFSTMWKRFQSCAFTVSWQSFTIIDP